MNINKKTTTFFISLALLLCSSVTFSQNKYTVKGAIQGWTEDYIVLVRQGNFPGMDSVKNTNGSFEFSGTINGITNAFIVARTAGSPKYLFFFLEPGTTEINGTFNDLQNATIKAQTQTSLYLAAREVHERFQTQKDSLYALRTSTQDSLKISQYNQLINGINEQEKKYTMEFVLKNPSSPVSLLELGKAIQKMSYKEIKTAWDGLDTELKSTLQAKELKTYVRNLENTQLGKIAPDFSQNDTVGRPIKLSDFHGKYVLIDFWASWCVPCRRENPNLVAAYKKYKPKGLEILGVSLDYSNGEKFWKRAIKNDGITWPQVSDLKGYNNEVSLLYAIQFVPSNFLIDPQGKIIAKNLTGEALHNKLAEIFNHEAKKRI